MEFGSGNLHFLFQSLDLDFEVLVMLGFVVVDVLDEVLCQAGACFCDGGFVG